MFHRTLVTLFLVAIHGKSPNTTGETQTVRLMYGYATASTAFGDATSDAVAALHAIQEYTSPLQLVSRAAVPDLSGVPAACNSPCSDAASAAVRTLSLYSLFSTSHVWESM